MMPLMRALDTLVLLESIKDTKACFSNDLAAYERAFQVCGYDEKRYAACHTHTKPLSRRAVAMCAMRS
jgi:hypothetical protein